MEILSKSGTVVLTNALTVPAPPERLVVADADYEGDLKEAIDAAWNAGQIFVYDPPPSFGRVGRIHQSQTVVTDQTFTASHVFDLGHVTVAYVTARLVAVTPDNETFAPDAVYAQTSLNDSRDSNTFDDAVSRVMTPNLVAVEDVAESPIFASKFLQVNVEIDDAGAGDIRYAGGNLPIVTVEFDVEYL